MSLFRPNKAFAIPIPTIPLDMRYVAFSFSCPYGSFQITLQYIDTNPEGVSVDNWLFSCTDSTNTVITGYLTPNCIHNSKSASYGITFISNLPSIGRDGISKTSMYLMVWI